MTRTRLILRNLRYFRAANLAVVAGMIVATAVLTGALMVGDSVRGSLCDLALRRLGPVDYALFSTRLFPEDLAKRLAAGKSSPPQFEQFVPGLILRGGAMDESQQRATGQVQIGALGGWIDVPPGGCIINQAVAAAVGVTKPGQTVLLTLPALTDLPRDAILARRAREDVTSGLRANLTSISPDQSFPSLFNLAGGQRTPRNAWVNLKDLQDQLDQPGRANVLLVKSKSDSSTQTGADALNSVIHDIATLADYGLRQRAGKNAEIAIESESTYIAPAIDAAAEAIAKDLNIPVRRVSAYLVNRVERLSAPSPRTPGEGWGEGLLPQRRDSINYAVIAGINSLGDGPIADNEIVINDWAAKQLKLRNGDRVRLRYYQRQSDGQLKEIDAPEELTFKGRILPMDGLGGDNTLTPQYKGITDQNSVADWKPPQGMHIDTKLADDAYWRKYKAAPKLFVSLATANRLWGNAYGDINSLRVPADRAKQFEQELLRRVTPADAGLAFIPIKSIQLQAASGSTDFSMLFVSFSFFIILAAALLVAMLFRLGIEQRARQFGLLGALGFEPKTLRRLAIAEGLLLAIIGGLLGSAAAVGYTWLMIFGLRTWWLGAVGTTALSLHTEYMTLAIGFIASIAIATLAILWAVWRLGKSEPTALLSGGWGRAAQLQSRRRRWPSIAAILAFALAIILVVAGAANRIEKQTAFMSGGGLLLVAAILFIGAQLSAVHRVESESHLSLSRLGARNASRRPSRSIATIALIAFASFVLVTVAAMKQPPPADSHDRRSGTGGFQLILQADVPLTGDLNSPSARRELLDIRSDAEPVLGKAHFLGLRSWAGQDISCLNITRPSSPTILAIPPDLIRENRFSFARTISKTDNPWDLLLHANTNDTIPVITDDETAQYILKLDIGGTIHITDQLGRGQTLQLVATLAHSIFQSEMLMAEDHFRDLFPNQGGFGTILVQAADADLPRLQKTLYSELKDYAITLESTPDRLARYQQIANTYLSTFQALGSLGLMLGTIGLAVILLRSLIERRGELALLSAIGFTHRARLRLVLSENVLLLLAGIAVGAACALVGVWPAVHASARAINWVQLAVTLFAVIIIGLLATMAALLLGGRRITAADLRIE